MSVEKILDEMRGGFTKKGPQCSVGLIFTSRGSDEQEALEKALSDSTIELVAVSRWLLKNGHDAKPHTLGRHRRKECRCDQWLNR